MLCANIRAISGIPNVALLDQDTGVVNGLGKTELVDASLQTALQEVFDLEGQDVIELHAGFVKHTDPDKTADERIAFEKSLWAVFMWSVFMFLAYAIVNLRTPSRRG